MNPMQVLRPRSASRKVDPGVALAAAMWLVASASSGGAEKFVSDYDRFEQSFESSFAYGNPLQEAALTVTFTSPQGDRLKAPGFWDGGKSWRVRFAPTQVGKWKFATVCSDPNNKGLQNQSGGFTVTAATGKTRFVLHGPIRVSLD